MSQPPPPPPPPPHGDVPKSSGLPPGRYDIFVIPPHSAGSGFLYLPSLQPNPNSFAAGFACAIFVVLLFQSMAPAFQAWWNSFNGLGNMGMFMLMMAVGIAAWALGRTQQDTGGGGHTGSGHGFGGTDPASSPGGTPPNTSAPPPPPPHNGAPPTPGTEKPRPSWQRPPPQPGTTRAETPKGSWEKAREETRRKEEERKAREEEQRRREEAAKRLKELREKEAREREQREREAREKQEKMEQEKTEKQEKEKKERQERERRERLEREKKEKLERELREKAQREKVEREALQERKRVEAEEASRKASTYAFSGVGEKINPWPNGKPKPAPSAAASSSPSTSSKDAQSSTFSNPNVDKRPPAPTARTYLGTDDDAYSYRPYDQPKKPARRKSNDSLSDRSWAPSQTTARTTPPPSVRAPYTTKDPDKIVIKAVYLFMNQFSKTPASQLVSGVGSVTDGLILRVTTEGLFIDDDVRGVPQREWDVKAWTLKLVEVWCPPHCLNPSTSTPGANTPNVLHKMASQRVRAGDRGATKTLTGDDADVYLTELLRACKDCCRLGLCESTYKNTNIPSPAGQTGEWRAKGLHLLRATIRDQEGKRYLFVLGEEESWKVAVGLQRLRRGTQARQLGVTGISASDARGTLEMLGWG